MGRNGVERTDRAPGHRRSPAAAPSLDGDPLPAHGDVRTCPEPTGDVSPPWRCPRRGGVPAGVARVGHWGRTRSPPAAEPCAHCPWRRDSVSCPTAWPQQPVAPPGVRWGERGLGAHMGTYGEGRMGSGGDGGVGTPQPEGTGTGAGGVSSPLGGPEPSLTHGHCSYSHEGQERPAPPPSSDPSTSDPSNSALHILISHSLTSQLSSPSPVSPASPDSP